MAQTIDRVALLRSLRGFTDEDPNPEDDMAPYDPAPVGQALDPRIPALMQARGVATQGAPKFSTPFEDEQMSSLESGIREASAPKPRRPWASMLQAGLEGLAFGKNAPAITAQRDADSRQALQDKIKRLQDIRQGVSQREMADISLQNTEATRDYRNQQLDVTKGRETRLGKASDAANQAKLRQQGLRLKKDPLTGELTSEYESVPRAEMSPEEVADLDTKQEAVELKKSQKELADATAELRNFQSDPNSPQYKNAEQRIAIAQQNANINKERLGLSERNTDIRQGIYEATGGISDARQRMQANAQSGLRAISTLRSELAKPGTLTRLAVPGAPQARLALAAKREMIDVLTRLRTGAALNKDEQAFYNAQAPGLLDALSASISDLDSTEQGVIEYKLGQFEQLFKALSGPNKVTVPASKAAPTGGSTPSGGGAAMPKVGEIRNGYKYLGGDPNDLKSWGKP